ncbi:MAG: hypothetical protein Kow0069_27240 [Promethearchaeota archaeon]
MSQERKDANKLDGALKGAPEDAGRVAVAGGRYRILGGRFHRMEKNLPIVDQDSGRLVGVTNPRDMTYIHSYGGEAPFFEALSEGRLLASRCDDDACEANGSVFLPFRIHCPDCLSKCTAVDVTGRPSTVYSFMVTERTGAFNTLPKPVKFVNVQVEGACTILMSVLAVGDPEIGMRVVPVFRVDDPTFTILDLAWVPEGTPAERLPPGFRFGAG